MQLLIRNAECRLFMAIDAERVRAVNKLDINKHKIHLITMNEQTLNAAIAMNNRCIEQFHNSSFSHTLSELRDALRLINQGTIYLPGITEVHQQPPLPLHQTSQGIPNRRQQQSSAIMNRWEIKFDPDEPSMNRIANTLTPIVPSFHLLRLVPVDQNDPTLSMTAQQQRMGNTTFD